MSGSEGHIRMRYNQYQTSGFNQPIELYSVRDWQRARIWVGATLDSIGAGPPDAPP